MATTFPCSPECDRNSPCAANSLSPMARHSSPTAFHSFRRCRTLTGRFSSLNQTAALLLVSDHALPAQWTIRRSVADTGHSDYHDLMSEPYDLRYDPTEVGADMVVECWISHGPRRDDQSFAPVVGEFLLIGDDELKARPARVIGRDGNRVWVQLALPLNASAVA